MKAKTLAKVAQSAVTDSAAAGAALAQELRRGMNGESPSAVIVFASPSHDFATLLRAIDEGCRPQAMVGTSSSGEFSSEGYGQGMACAVALKASDMRFTASAGRGLSTDRGAAARALTSRFLGIANPAYAYRTALVLTDALAGHADELVEQLAALTGGTYRLFGGGAGGDAQFQKRFVFCGTEVIADGVVALEILSNKPIGIGVRHGWTPSSSPYRVTDAAGPRLGSLDAVAAADVFEEHAQRTGRSFDRKAPLLFFLHNILGIDTGAGHKLRVPLSVLDDGAVACATEVPEGVSVCVMNVTNETTARAAAESTEDAVRQLEGNRPAVALFFDCVATRLRMGDTFGFELDAVQRALGDAQFAGCNSIGQIASAEGQFSGFHNCTAVVCVIPE